MEGKRDPINLRGSVNSMGSRLSAASRNKMSNSGPCISFLNNKNTRRSEFDSHGSSPNKSLANSPNHKRKNLKPIFGSSLLE